MRIPPELHRWDVDSGEAVRIQRELASRVVRSAPAGSGLSAGDLSSYRFVGGVDAAFSSDGRRCLACAVVWDRSTRTLAEHAEASAELLFPYIPGLLSFREVPAVLAALEKLSITPDVLFCDGQGIAHPRRLGIASHLGVILGMPAVGCAKSRLTGSYREPALERGSRSALRDRGEVIGTVLRTKDRVKPIFVSVGHLIDLDAAAELVLACGAGYRLPEPTRLADRLVAEYKKGGGTG